MKNELNNLDLKLEQFKHKVSDIVKFAEVDSFGVVHNIQYLYWIEWARTKYLSDLGIKLRPTTFIEEYPLMVVHSEIDYFNSLKFGDRYTVLSAIVKVKNSSLAFENYVINDNNQIIVKASSVLVHLNPETMESVRINDKLREKIQNFEKDNVSFVDV